jgi:cysteinyl-tRNA synthetase
MDLLLTNTLTRQKELFQSLDALKVGLYSCGPTVYGPAHLGNLRTYVFSDTLRRVLEINGFKVKHVMNITDVGHLSDDADQGEDKVEREAARTGASAKNIARTYEAAFRTDLQVLNIFEPTVWIRATECIGDQVALIQRLEAKGVTYRTDDGIYFDTSTFPTYGAMAKLNLEGQRAGARVQVAAGKRNPSDFALWKFSPAGVQRQMQWDSPWGVGFPGWHIECSAMSWKHLGEVFDIHGGGIDLVFPHHENEIAQTRCAFHTGVMANFWMHNGFLQVEGEKMSKSLGNFVTIRELLSRFVGDAIRLTMMETHYRQPIDWTRSGLDNSRRQLFQWAQLIEGHHVQDSLKQPNLGDADSEFIELLSDDLNMPSALARLRQMFNEAHLDRQMASRFASHVAFLGFRNLDKPGFFRSGFAHYVPEGRPQISADTFFDVMSYQAATANSLPIVASSYLNRVHSAGINTSIDLQGNVIVGYAADPQAEFNDRVRFLIEARSKARVEKNWAESDRIRDELAAMGVVLKDSKDGTTWEIAR